MSQVGAQQSPNLPGARTAPAAWWMIVREMWTGDPQRVMQALDRAGRVAALGGHAVWLLTAGAGGVAGGLYYVAARVALSRESAWIAGPSFGEVIRTLLMLIVLYASFIALRGVALRSLFRRLDREISLRGAALVANTTYQVWAICTLGLALLQLIFGNGWFGALIASIVVIALLFYTETYLFILTARTGQFERSPVMLYAVVNTCWLIMSGLVVGLMLLITSGINPLDVLRMVSLAGML